MEERCADYTISRLYGGPTVMADRARRRGAGEKWNIYYTLYSYSRVCVRVRFVHWYKRAEEAVKCRVRRGGGSVGERWQRGGRGAAPVAGVTATADERRQQQRRQCYSRATRRSVP